MLPFSSMNDVLELSGTYVNLAYLCDVQTITWFGFLISDFHDRNGSRLVVTVTVLLFQIFITGMAPKLAVKIIIATSHEILRDKYNKYVRPTDRSDAVVRPRRFTVAAAVMVYNAQILVRGMKECTAFHKAWHTSICSKSHPASFFSKDKVSPVTTSRCSSR